MGYVVECFDSTGTRVGYGSRGRIRTRPHWYSSPSAGRVAASAVIKNNPKVHCFVNRFVNIRWRFQ